MMVSVLYHSQTFSDGDKKVAYKKATNWLAKYVMTARDEVKDTTYKIEYLRNENVPTFKVYLYCSIDTTQEQNSFCDACKAFHKSFFINQEYNCNACKTLAFNKRVSDKLSIKRSYRREKLKAQLDR